MSQIHFQFQRRLRRRRSVESLCFLAVAILLYSACPADPEPPVSVPPPEICQGLVTLGSEPYFSDDSEALGLGGADLDAQGNLLASADIDGDRWPDLFLSKGLRGERDDPDNPAYNVRLLRNLHGQGFADITFASGLTQTRDGAQGRAMQFALFADFNDDGLVDVYSANFLGDDTFDTGDRSEILINQGPGLQGQGQFAFGPQNFYSDSFNSDPVVSATNLDYDHDGLIDLFIGHHYGSYGILSSCQEDKLLHNIGFGALDDVTDAVGLATVPAILTADMMAGRNHRPTWGVSACDLDGDSWPELLVSSYGRQGNLLWRADGQGGYSDQSVATGFAADDNLDYSDNEFYRCYCHSFGGQCDPMPPAPSISCDADYWTAGVDDQPYRLGGNSSNTLCGDLDNDGDLYLLQVELAHWHIGQSSDKTELLYNEGLDQGGLRRPGNAVTGLTRTHSAGWNEGDLGGALFDFDNDGRLDVLIASSDYPDTHSILWHQQQDGSFVDVTLASGLNHARAHGLSLIDFDRDGDLDVVMGTSMQRWHSTDVPPRPDRAAVHLYRNMVGQDGNRLIIDIQGAGKGAANRLAIGARVVVTAGSDTYVREQQGGHGLSGQQNDALMILGVGEHCSVDAVEVHWPDAAQSVTRFADVRANYVLIVRQGQDLQYQTLAEYRGQD